MKHKLLILGICIAAFAEVFGQTPPMFSGGSTGSDWSRSGNLQGIPGNNIFGTRWNSPIYTVTGGLTMMDFRTKMNAPEGPDKMVFRFSRFGG